MEKCKTRHNHKGHLCVLAGTQDFDQISKLAARPRFICFNCGRVARAEENLCNPMPLQVKESS